jgi:hypothetical protein
MKMNDLSAIDLERKWFETHDALFARELTSLGMWFGLGSGTDNQDPCTWLLIVLSAMHGNVDSSEQQVAGPAVQSDSSHRKRIHDDVSDSGADGRVARSVQPTKF